MEFALLDMPWGGDLAEFLASGGVEICGKNDESVTVQFEAKRNKDE